MKKTLVVAAGLAVLSTSAFATKVKNDSTKPRCWVKGSYYMDDERNAFRSAGSFGGNYVYIEHGSGGSEGRCSS